MSWQRGGVLQVLAKLLVFPGADNVNFAHLRNYLLSFKCVKERPGVLWQWPVGMSQTGVRMPPLLAPGAAQIKEYVVRMVVYVQPCLAR